MDQAFLHWFAGFVAGEGSFKLYRRPNTNVFTPQLAIQLREDDLDILLEIQERLQLGTISCYTPRDPNWQPLAQWIVRSYSECLQLVEILDGYPLRAKKQRDYLIWREAVLELQKPFEQRDVKKLEYLHDKLHLVKRYEPAIQTLEEYESLGIQLNLPGIPD